jgi:peptidoglycan/xylan/chitin deacetylase (PgdA/CDA1 family)
MIPSSASPRRNLAQKIGLAMSARPVPLTWPGGVISLTFDDFPKSALAAGGDILERYHARGTYYACYASLKLAWSDKARPIFDHQDLRAAHRAGHEIACHTYTHPDLACMAKPMILAEVRNNAAALSALIEGFVPTNFAYPYGRVSITAKRVLVVRIRQMVPVLPSRRPRESGGPGRRVRRWQPWVPAFAGMTMRGAGTKRQIRTTRILVLVVPRD